jgi:hypothetical protein
VTRRRAIAAVAGAVLLFPRDARAEDQEETFGIAAGVSVGMMAIIADLAFTGYTGASVAELKEPSQSWMIAQTAVGGASALVMNGLGLALAAEDHREEGYEMATLPISIWTGALAVFGGWSLAEPGETDLRARLGLSFVASTNLAFTTLGIGAHFDERPASFYVAIPELALMAPECVLTAIKAADDPDNKAAWATLSVWSGLLTAHAAINLIARGVEGDTDAIPPPAIEAPAVPAVTDPYYIDPSGPIEVVPPIPPADEVKPPLVVPAAIPGGASLGPGFMMVGRF